MSVIPARLKTVLGPRPTVRPAVPTRHPPRIFRESYTTGALAGPILSKQGRPLSVEVMQLCENAYLKEPLTRKGILKRSHDVFERWFRVVSDNPKVEEVAADLENRLDLKNRLIDLLKNAMIYGAGYLEVVYDGDDAPAAEPPTPNAPIASLELIDPKSITPVWDDDPKSDTYGEVISFEQDPGNPSLPKLQLHPDRVIYFTYDTIGDGRRPVGVIEPMLHVVESKIVLDKAAGRIPKKVLSQIILAKIEGATQEELDAWATALENMSEVGLFVGTETVDIQVENTGKVLDIKAYSEHLTYQIAGGVGVPYTVLLGAGAGSISTSETNLRDYYSDLRDLQVRFTPILRRVLTHELAAAGVDAEYEIEWAEIYADERSEAEVLLTKARAIDLLAANGVIGVNEAREILGLPPIHKEQEDRQVGPPINGHWYEG